ELAKRQFGIVSFKQALELGLTRDQIRYGVETGRWSRVLPGVIRAAWAEEGFHSRALAAWLWAGQGSLVSHEAAAFLWGMIPDETVDVVVTVPSHRRSPVRWLRLHETPNLFRTIRRVRQEIPVTSPARTLVDLAARPWVDLEAIWLGALRRGL